MDLIDQFIARYTKEYDYYSQAAYIAQRILENDLQSAGVRAIVTARAKSFVSVENKCRKRAASKGAYSSVEEIYNDIVDLAGVRIALYFPAEGGQVDGAIGRLFQVADKRKFPEEGKERPGSPRFSGYGARHYRVTFKEDSLGETEKRYSAARIEIQVASVLMHSWSEVEHDLVYKSPVGKLSDEEYALLDQLNGLVLSGEIALERLQKAGEDRVASTDRRIASHYDLAVLLLSAGAGLTDQPINDAGLGRVDILFDFIDRLKINTPGLLEPFISALHGNIELRPLAEQIVDILLDADAGRYEIYNEIRARHLWLPLPDSADASVHVGRFMKSWIELEAMLRGLNSHVRSYGLPNSRELVEMGILTRDEIYDFDQLRRMRNFLVHGVEVPDIAALDEASARLEGILVEIKRRLDDMRDAATSGQAGDDTDTEGDGQSDEPDESDGGATG
jgi:ppGpp synthetase/RelA/SpoT-type nucleotidyltranferase